MTIDGLIESFCNALTQSETEVRTKLANPLSELLGYPTQNRAEEFPVYGFEGGKPINCKPADILIFSSNDYATKRSRNIDDRKWVYNNSLLLIETKKRGESIEAEGQAIYYAAWTRTPLYIVTNGETIRFYKVNANFTDDLIIECTIPDIAINWSIVYESFSFFKALQLKNTAYQLNQTDAYDMYMDYCSNMIVDLDVSLNRMLRRQVSKSPKSSFDTRLYTDAREQIDYKDIFKQNDSVVIVSEPGGGKSYLLSMIARDALSSICISNKIPIIVRCEYFNFTFRDIVTAVFNTVSPFCPAVTEAIVKHDIRDGKYMLLFDALDEVKSDRNVLVGMIQEVILSTKNKIAVSERQENYNNEFSAVAEKYYILPLDDSFIEKYISDNTKYHLSYYAMNLDRRFKSLLARPLFLFIFVEILNNQTQDGYRVPKNTTVLFENFISYPLRQKQVPATEINLTDQILSLYAEWLMQNQESDAKLIEYIHETVGVAQTEKYMDIVKKSGVVIRGVNGLRFFHNTFLEYFFAKRMVQYNESAITEFLRQHQNLDRYHVIICFMVGIISNENKQNVVLDYLQEHNLSLFIKALNSRYKFNRLQTDIEFNYSNAYFTQIRNTYLQLIDMYFSNIKTFLLPFSRFINGENQKLKLVGEINTSNHSISINLVCADKEDTDVEFSTLTSSPQVFVGDEKVSTPIFSLSNNNGYYFYDLAALYLGLDSAREIAVDMIKDQLFKLIKSKTIFDVSCPILMTECIEDVLDYLRKRRLLPNGSTDISLSNSPEQVLAFLFSNRDKPSINHIGFHGPAINFELLYLYCYMLISSQKDIEQFVLPKQDVSTPKLGENKRAFCFDFFSSEQLKGRIQKIIELSERGYEELVLSHFPALYDRLVESNTHHYYQYVKLNCSGNGWEISQIIISTPTRKNEVVVVIDDLAPSKLTHKGWQLSDDLKLILAKIGATEKDIISQSYGYLHEYLSENVLHNFIYNKLEQNFKVIFEGKEGY